jgi:D-serine deaminase-like pyridoxal phosphate-dependent protein
MRFATGADRTLDLLGNQVGRTLAEVETPVAVVDLDRMETNIARLSAYAAEHQIALWPHGKTHKAPVVAARQRAAGAQGVTVAKTGEAEVYFESGIERILLHYPPMGAAKWNRLAVIVGEGLDLTVAVDSLEPALGLSQALRRTGGEATVLVELDVGLRRTGKISAADALALAQALDELPALSVVGISGYPGMCHGDADEVDRLLRPGVGLMEETRELLVAAGLSCERISGGSTPTRYITHTTCVNELRAGTYALLDTTVRETEPEGLGACALWVEVTVVSDSVPGQIVIDAGSKTLAADHDETYGYGAIVGRPDLTLVHVNEEHGYVDASGDDDPPRVGDRLRVIPTHACACVNLHDGLLGIRGDIVEDVISVAARGLIR